MSVYANEGFYALAGFAKVVGAIDGSSVPIITPINVSVHPPHDPRVIGRHVPSLFVRFSFVLLHSASLCTLYSTLTPMHYYLPLFPMITLIMLKLNFQKYPAIHTNYITPKAPLYNIIIIVDTVFRQKRNFKHEKK